MSSSSFAATLELAPKASVRALIVLFWVHVAVVALALFAMQPGAAMAGLVLAVGASWLALRRHPALGFGPRALVRLIWHAQGGWTLHDAAGRRFDADLLGHSHRHRRLIVLDFRLRDGTRRTRLLLGDELDAEMLRRLRARLTVPAGQPLG
ncbi:MAG: hypothetical protein HYV18_03945 [Gammaproteobacteria bacterium]|nr:hypothetical protein [Gammaproteobacteria bacterium]